MVTVKSKAWHYRDRALLLGDAAHAIVPFFGQGMNCGFEDCTVLDELLSGPGASSLEQVFAALETRRKTNSDAIGDLAVENFVEMRDKVANPRFCSKKRSKGSFKKGSGRVCFAIWACDVQPEPYRFAYEMGVVQKRHSRGALRRAHAPEQVNLARAGALIREKLSPNFSLNKKGNS